MFTGIIETIGIVRELTASQSNLDIWVESSISTELKIDQSVSHNGVCLTVTAKEGSMHRVTAIQETLLKSNLNTLKVGDKVNLERCMLTGSRFDGHIVQGHVDQTAICIAKHTQEGSWLFTFSYDQFQNTNITVEKGSITVNGTSLTVVNSQNTSFSVAIIPYTYENTVFQQINVGDTVNLEFDIIGKYIAKIMERQL